MGSLTKQWFNLILIIPVYLKQLVYINIILWCHLSFYMKIMKLCKTLDPLACTMGYLAGFVQLITYKFSGSQLLDRERISFVCSKDMKLHISSISWSCVTLIEIMSDYNFFQFSRNVVAFGFCLLNLLHLRFEIQHVNKSYLLKKLVRYSWYQSEQR